MLHRSLQLSASLCLSPSATRPAFSWGLSNLAAVVAGATLTATSVGITARVLSDLNRLQEPESQIVLGAAVIDDVIGLVILAVVAGVARGEGISAWGVAQHHANCVWFSHRDAAHWQSGCPSDGQATQQDRPSGHAHDAGSAASLRTRLACQLCGVGNDHRRFRGGLADPRNARCT